jgi:hypothetical protein
MSSNAALLSSSFVTTQVLESQNVKASAVFSPQIWLSSASGEGSGSIVDSDGWISIQSRIKQLELQNNKITNMELKLTSLIQSVQAILVYLNQLKVAVELITADGTPVDPPLPQ